MNQTEFWQMILARLRKYVSQDWDDRISLIARMTGTAPATIGEWLTTDRPAKGERLLKLWHILAAAGLESPELQQLRPYNRYLGELFAFGVIDTDELLQILNIKNPQAAFSVLRGALPARPNLSEAELQQLYNEPLAHAKQQVPQYGHASAPPVAAAQVPAEPPTAPAVASVPLVPTAQPSTVVSMLAMLLGAASPLARLVVSDEYSPEARSQLRHLMGESGMFELSNTLSRLCSERARTRR